MGQGRLSDIAFKDSQYNNRQGYEITSRMRQHDKDLNGLQGILDREQCCQILEKIVLHV